MSQLAKIMRGRVEKLMDGARKKILLEAIDDDISPKQAISVNCLIGTGAIGKTSADGFDRITKRDPFIFPENHFTHKKQALEWYMGGGNLQCVRTDSNGNKIGSPKQFICIFTFFFRRIEPGNQKMILESHFSLVAENEKHFQSETSSVWNIDNVLELPDAQSGKFAIKTTNLELKTLREDEFFFKHLKVQGQDTKQKIAINLELKRLRPFLLQCGDGYMGNVENGIAYGYYSAPLLSVQGTIQYQGDSYDIIDGSFGMDHEWGTIGRPLSKKLQNICDFLYALGTKFRFLDTGFGLYGWESWFGFYFEDGSFITTVAASIKRFKKNEWITPEFPNSQYLDADGIQTTLTDLKLRLVEFAEIEGSNYPIKYEFSGTPQGNFFITAMVPDQRMRWAGGGFGYEGGVIVTDSAGQKIGTGILENCGWDDKFTKSVLAQLGIDESHAKLFNSRGKRRGNILVFRVFSILALIIGLGSWAIAKLIGS